MHLADHKKEKTYQNIGRKLRLDPYLNLKEPNIKKNLPYNFNG